MAPVYATSADYEAFDPAFDPAHPSVGLWGTMNELIEQAEVYIDSAVGRYTPNSTTGRKFDPTNDDLTVHQVNSLEKATCAQVQYMLLKGPEFFMTVQFEQKTSGRGVSSLGQERYLAPKARMHLNAGSLFKLVGGRGFPGLWAIPNQNIDQEPW